MYSSIRVSAFFTLGLLVAYYVLRGAATNCAGPVCEGYVVPSLVLPLLILAAAAVAALVAVFTARRIASGGELAWLSAASDGAQSVYARLGFVAIGSLLTVGVTTL